MGASPEQAAAPTPSESSPDCLNTVLSQPSTSCLWLTTPSQHLGCSIHGEHPLGSPERASGFAGRPPSAFEVQEQGISEQQEQGISEEQEQGISEEQLQGISVQQEQGISEQAPWELSKQIVLKTHLPPA